MTEEEKGFPINRIQEVVSAPEDFRLLERVPLTKTNFRWPVELSEPVGDERPIVLLDVETTGLDPVEDEIIELGLVRATYSLSASSLTSVQQVTSLFEEPSLPIPPRIVEITGITDEMVAGKRIDDELVDEWLSDRPLIVAHNAGFDRPFFEKRFPQHADKPWACSLHGIDWSAANALGRKLEVLLLGLGWFYDAHRAATDCLAMAWLFHQDPAAFAQLLERARRKTVIVRAFGTPIEVKDDLKARGYRWYAGERGGMKHWWCEVEEAELGAEQDFLEKLSPGARESAQYDYVDAFSRYKAG